MKKKKIVFRSYAAYLKYFFPKLYKEKYPETEEQKIKSILKDIFKDFKLNE